jgi:hypothetical protein
MVGAGALVIAGVSLWEIMREPPMTAPQLPTVPQQGSVRDDTKISDDPRTDEGRWFAELTEVTTIRIDNYRRQYGSEFRADTRIRFVWNIPSRLFLDGYWNGNRREPWPTSD